MHHIKQCGTTRRSCIKLMAATAGGSVVGIGGALSLSKLGRIPDGEWLVLNQVEVNTLGALVDQIIPADDYPGALDAGALNFIDRQLDGPYNYLLESYQSGVHHLNLLSLELHKTPFHGLEWNTRTRLLELVEAGQVPEHLWNPASARSFFNMVLDHTRQSYYGSPRHGGNQNYASYRMMGIEYPHFTGRNRHPCIAEAHH